jgi:hypothetical protein
MYTVESRRPQAIRAKTAGSAAMNIQPLFTYLNDFPNHHCKYWIILNTKHHLTQDELI